ncbi:hypothetical protein BGS_1352 [Beggiatoa sp. SS]|nr:hypothetical protein BGS_1352 [Beggiatoa sp. SS]
MILFITLFKNNAFTNFDIIGKMSTHTNNHILKRCAFKNIGLLNQGLIMFITPDLASKLATFEAFLISLFPEMLRF